MSHENGFSPQQVARTEEVQFVNDTALAPGQPEFSRGDSLALKDYRLSRRRLLGITGAGAVILGAELTTAKKVHDLSQHPDDLAEFSRDHFGEKFTLDTEGKWFGFQDRKKRFLNKLFGGPPKNPYSSPSKEIIVPARKPQPKKLAAEVTPQPTTTPEFQAEKEVVVFQDAPDLPISQETPTPLAYHQDKDSVVPEIKTPDISAQIAPQEDPEPEPTKPSPMPLPEVQLIQPGIAGEGVWITDGLPYSSPEDMFMTKTFTRPDIDRQYATVNVLLMDKRRTRLHVVGGTRYPGEERGIRGPGEIPDADIPALVVGKNGGFLGAHGAWGMYANGKTYKPLANGYASIAVTVDGTVMMGEWGRTISWSDDIVGVRQNARLLVEDGELTSDARGNNGLDNNRWGYVVAGSAQNITWRSAIGLTANGDLLFADGNDLSANTLAKALKSAGAQTAMQLDINTPYVLTSLFFSQPDGSEKATLLVPNNFDKKPDRFLARNQERDFFYVTRDESKYTTTP